jgi:hypothetical protein
MNVNYSRRLSAGEKLNVIATRKRRGDVTKVALRTGYSVSYVSEVLNFQYNNDAIVNAAYDIARKRKQRNSL